MSPSSPSLKNLPQAYQIQQRFLDLIFTNVSGLWCLIFSLFTFTANSCQLSLFHCARLLVTDFCGPLSAFHLDEFWGEGVWSQVSRHNSNLIWFPKHVSSLSQQRRITQRTSADSNASHCRLFLAPVHHPASNRAWRREGLFSLRALLAL